MSGNFLKRSDCDVGNEISFPDRPYRYVWKRNLVSRPSLPSHLETKSRIQTSLPSRLETKYCCQTVPVVFLEMKSRFQTVLTVSSGNESRLLTVATVCLIRKRNFVSTPSLQSRLETKSRFRIAPTVWSGNEVSFLTVPAVPSGNEISCPDRPYRFVWKRHLVSSFQAIPTVSS